MFSITCSRKATKYHSENSPQAKQKKDRLFIAITNNNMLSIAALGQARRTRKKVLPTEQRNNVPFRWERLPAETPFRAQGTDR